MVQNTALPKYLEDILNSHCHLLLKQTNSLLETHVSFLFELEGTAA